MIQLGALHAVVNPKNCHFNVTILTVRKTTGVSMQEELKFRLCDSSNGDFEILRKIHRSTMEGPIVLTMGEWNEEFQLEKIRERYEESSKTLKFLMSGDREIGTINYWRKKFEDGSFNLIEQFYILPEFQGTGLGGKVLQEHLKFDITRLSVLNGDQGRMLYYRKRGFLPYKVEQVRTYFEWKPTGVLIQGNEPALENKDLLLGKSMSKVIVS